MGLEIDHVVFCVADLDLGASVLLRDHGLESLEGGKHLGHGTANRIVPLGSTYMELVSVVDEQAAGASGFGRWVESRAGDELTPHALCLRTDDLDAVCRRLGLDATVMSRERPDGSELRWRLAGLESMIELGLPFFIQWEVEPNDHPGAGGQERSQIASVSITLTGDVDLLGTWAGGTPGLVLGPGEPGVAVVVISIAGRRRLVIGDLGSHPPS